MRHLSITIWPNIIGVRWIWRNLYRIKGATGKLAGKTVVDVAVVRLIGSDDQYDVAQSGIFRHFPIVLGN